jgi:hypothetical protein
MELWSWALTAIGFVVMWISGKDRRGWLLGIGWEVLWAVFAVVTHQWGFLLGAIVSALIFGRNYRVGRTEEPC